MPIYKPKRIQLLFQDIFGEIYFRKTNSIREIKLLNDDLKIK